ncbi:MAG: AIPR family protein [Geobacter sp.]|nr:AIPR family protein [Geobacter sp.]
MKSPSSKSVIIKFADYHQKDFGNLSRITGVIDSKNMVRLLKAANLEANPRKPKKGEVTESIIDSLTQTPELFHFKSKGLLLSSGKVSEMERHRFQLNFEDLEIEGVLDGGHNCLGIGLYLLDQVIDDDDERKSLDKVKLWEDFEVLWNKYCSYFDEIEPTQFYVPVEVIFPSNDDVELENFINSILDIAQARNNNAELTEETKANKKGFYELIKQHVDPTIKDKVEWKTNDGGTIKARDLIALSLIPLSVLPGKIKGGVEDNLFEVNPVIIYSSKSQCVERYNNIIDNDKISEKVKGDIVKVTCQLVDSALSLMKDFPKLYDIIYEKLPDAYNNSSAGFGRISCVKIYEKDKTKKSEKYLHKSPKTKFYSKDVTFSYPDGFIMPIVYSMRELIIAEDNQVKWIVDPFDFIDKNLDKILETYYSQIQVANYDPQKVGKHIGSYKLVSSAVKFILTEILYSKAK